MRRALPAIAARAATNMGLHVTYHFARHCGASVSRLARLLKQQTEVSPQQFLERHRMQHACQLLRRTSLGISEIASEVGYADAFYFSNRFRRYAGKSPSQFRQQAD